MLLDVLGTWEMVVSALCEPVLTPEVQRMGVLVDSHVARDRYAAMGATVARDMLEWFKREIGRPARGPRGGRRRVGTADRPRLAIADWQQWRLLPAAHVGQFLSGAGSRLVRRRLSGCATSRGRATCFVRVIEGLNYQFLEIVRAFECRLGGKE